eukprot:gene35578-46142_t
MWCSRLYPFSSATCTAEGASAIRPLMKSVSSLCCTTAVASGVRRGRPYSSLENISGAMPWMKRRLLNWPPLAALWTIRTFADARAVAERHVLPPVRSSVRACGISSTSLWNSVGNPAMCLMSSKDPAPWRSREHMSSGPFLPIWSVFLAQYVLEEAYEFIADLGIDVESTFNSTKTDDAGGRGGGAPSSWLAAAVWEMDGRAAVTCCGDGDFLHALRTAVDNAANASSPSTKGPCHRLLCSI